MTTEAMSIQWIVCAFVLAARVPQSVAQYAPSTDGPRAVSTVPLDAARRIVIDPYGNVISSPPSPQHDQGGQPATPTPAGTQIIIISPYAQGHPPPYELYSDWGYPYSYRDGLRAREFSAGRAIERYRQNAAELRGLVEALRQRIRGDTWTRRLYPLDAYTDRHAYPFERPRYRSHYDTPWDRHYRYGRDLERYRQQELAAREELTLLAHQSMLLEGVRQFRAGRYAAAARSFIGAAEKHHGDAASRLHAAQALTALGNYSRALGHVRRAFELQPLLIHLPIDIETDYGIKEDFAKHINHLSKYCRSHPDDKDAHLLLAYEHLFSSAPAEAAEPLRRARALDPEDPLANKLWETAKLFIPSSDK